MKMCKNCRYKGCALCGTDHVIHAADCETYTPASNADRIRSMTDEELAVFIRDQIIDRNIGIPSETWLDWLRQEVSE